MESRGNGLLILLTALLVAAGAVFLSDGFGNAGRAATTESFQRLTHGMGFGPSLDLTDCTFSFDPRLDDSCAHDCGAIPGGACFCPQHAGSILYYPHARNALWDN